MNRNGKNVSSEAVKEGLSARIGRMFAVVLRRVLIIVCMESVLISGVFAIMYSLNSIHTKAYFLKTQENVLVKFIYQIEH